MSSLDPYLDKFSESGKRVLKSALDELRRRKQRFISPEHILYALMEEETELFNSTMRSISIEPNAVRLAVEKRLEKISQYTGEGFRIAPETTDIFKFSMDRARSQGRRVIEASDILGILTTTKYNLLNDILQNPDTLASTFNANRINTEGKQNRFPTQLQNKPSNFLAQFSLKDLAEKNNSFSGLFHSMGGGGRSSSCGSLSRGDSEQTVHHKQESFSFYFNSKDSNNFNEEEFISSLREDVEDSINQSGLKITKNPRENSSSFRFEYTKGKMKGEIDIFGEMNDEYYQLQTIISEKTGWKTQ